MDQLTTYRLPSTIRHLPPDWMQQLTTYRLPPTIYHLPPDLLDTYRLTPDTYHLPPDTYHLTGCSTLHQLAIFGYNCT